MALAGGCCVCERSLATLNPKQQVFVAYYIGEAKHNATEAARLAGYKQPHVKGSQLLAIVSVKEAVDAHLAAVKKRGIANKQNRVDALVRRHHLMEQVISERAVDPFVADVPGGTTGLIVKQLKKVKYIYMPDPDDKDGKASVAVEDQWEAAVDTGLLKELRDHEKQAAQEVGDWTERSELVGDADRPVSIRLVRT